MINFVRAACCIVLAFATLGAGAQDSYPNRPIRVIVPYPAGGASDVLARLITTRLAEDWKVSVVVDNRPGGNTIIAYEAAAKAAPDGYTILQSSETIGTNVSLYRKLPYDALKDLTPIGRTGSLPLVIVANNALLANSIAALVAMAKERPGQLNYASFGSGSSSHLAGELFKSMAKVSIAHVPYKGAPPALTDLIGGQVQIFFSGLPPALPFVKSGKVKALAVTGLRRSPLLPDVPTLVESGFPGYEALSWSGMLAPAGTPPAIIAKWNAQVTSILKLPEIREKMLSLGFEPQTSTPEEFGAFIRGEMSKWTTIAKEAGIQLD